MTDKEFVEWFKGFVDGAHHFNITPAQWDHLKEKLKQVETKNTIADYSVGNWTLNHTWQ